MSRFPRMSIVISSLLTAMLLHASVAGAAQQRTTPSRDIRFLQDVSYNAGPDADPKYQVSDLYLPAGKKNFPMLFFIHGGGWRAGDKVYDGLDHIVNICYDLGMGVMSINYRMGKNIDYKTEMRDTAMAFAWLYKNGGAIWRRPKHHFRDGRFGRRAHGGAFWRRSRAICRNRVSRPKTSRA